MSLRADAAYCAAAALLVCALAPLLAPELGISMLWCFVAGGVVAVWAALLWLWSGWSGVTPVLWFVMVVNVVAALGIGASATAVASAALTVLLAAVALEVAAFAVSQAVAIQRIPQRAPRMRDRSRR